MFDGTRIMGTEMNYVHVHVHIDPEKNSSTISA